MKYLKNLNESIYTDGIAAALKAGGPEWGASVTGKLIINSIHMLMTLPPLVKMKFFFIAFLTNIFSFGLAKTKIIIVD